MGPVFETNISQYTGLHIKIVELIFDLVKECWVLIVDSLEEELQAGP